MRYKGFSLRGKKPEKKELSYPKGFLNPSKIDKYNYPTLFSGIVDEKYETSSHFAVLNKEPFLGLDPKKLKIAGRDLDKAIKINYAAKILLSPDNLPPEDDIFTHLMRMIPPVSLSRFVYSIGNAKIKFKMPDFDSLGDYYLPFRPEITYTSQFPEYISGKMPLEEIIFRLIDNNPIGISITSSERDTSGQKNDSYKAINNIAHMQKRFIKRELILRYKRGINFRENICWENHRMNFGDNYIKKYHSHNGRSIIMKVLPFFKARQA